MYYTILYFILPKAKHQNVLNFFFFGKQVKFHLKKLGPFIEQKSVFKLENIT